MTDDLDDIPPTEPSVAVAPKKRGRKANPDTGKPAVAPTRSAAPMAMAGAKTKMPGKSLVPDLERHRGSVDRSFWYWIGVTPSCPVEHIDIAGENFPKVNELISKDRTGKQQRIPVIGALVKLTEGKIRKMREKLSRLVIRFRADAGQHDEPGTGENLGDPHIRPRKGFVITIPTDEEIQAKTAAKLPARRYVQQANDEPAARYMFAVLCGDQERGNRGDFYPEPLEVTGLDWPEEMTEE